MAIEIVDLPIKDGDFPVRYVNVYQRVAQLIIMGHYGNRLSKKHQKTRYPGLSHCSRHHDATSLVIFSIAITYTLW